ncbi:hypothetical protein ACFYT4_31955 [Streptomyces sp. NPDC004609]|uniref:hypothetical protein n=1 Tax=Streptomyces sp. NPDC004609 TaxID=3364704 RepID=UPI00368C11AD
MLDAEGGGVGASNGASDLEKGVGALKRFQQRVNTLLADFENGAAGRTKVAAQTVSRTSLSGPSTPFAEADGLYGQYNRVHAALVSLSRTLSDQIECLSIAVHAAEVGLDNVDEERRWRFAQIRARLDQEREAAQERERKALKPAPQNTDDKTVDSGW